jgi:hypothetical protein
MLVIHVVRCGIIQDGCATESRGCWVEPPVDDDNQFMLQRCIARCGGMCTKLRCQACGPFGPRTLISASKPSGTAPKRSTCAWWVGYWRGGVEERRTLQVALENGARNSARSILRRKSERAHKRTLRFAEQSGARMPSHIIGGRARNSCISRRGHRGLRASTIAINVI